MSSFVIEKGIVDALLEAERPSPRYYVKLGFGLIDSDTGRQLCLSEIADRLNREAAGKGGRA